MDDLNEEMEEMEENTEEEQTEVNESRAKFLSKCLDKYTGKKITTPLKAIHEKCYNCSGFQWNEVRQCTVYDCTLYPFRFGKSPYRNPKKMTEEERQEKVERMKNIRARQLAEKASKDPV